MQMFLKDAKTETDQMPGGGGSDGGGGGAA